MMGECIIQKFKLVWKCELSGKFWGKILNVDNHR